MIKTVSIVGLGIIGASFAKAIAANTGCTVYGIDTNQQTMRDALEDGVIAAAADARHLGRSDLVIVALYPKDAVSFVREHIAELSPGAILRTRMQVCRMGR